MIEPIMYLAIGFLVAMLLGLMVLPLVHNRAVRLTTKRLEASTPISMAEIQADKDQLRAEFAMSARRLELSVDQLKNKATNQLAELGKKTDAINRLKIELSEKSARIFELEARERGARDQLKLTEEEFAAKTELLRVAEQALEEKRGALLRLTTELSDRSMLADTRQVELVAVRTQIESLQARVGEAEKEFHATQERLDREKGESATATRDLGEERERVGSLTRRVADLDEQLLAQIREAETLGGRVVDLEHRLAVSEQENADLRRQIMAATEAAKALHSDVSARHGADPVESLRAEKAALQSQLTAEQEARGKAQRELSAMQAQTENAWATERMENALLRERINDIAAEVAKMAMTLEGPNSPIEAILSGETTGQQSAQASAVTPISAGASPPAPAPAVAGGTLADRIRALQSHASRAARQAG